MKRPAIAPPYQPTPREQDNRKQLLRHDTLNGLPEVWAEVSRRFGQITALIDPHVQPVVSLTYSELSQQIEQFAAGLQALKVHEEPWESDDLPPRVALFADDSPRWLIADQGTMMAGTADVVRSSQADRDELLFILEDSGARTLIVENLATLKKLRAGLGGLPLKQIILLSDETGEAIDGVSVANFSQVMELGRDRTPEPVKWRKEVLATLIYTSGTTGKPKGVMLTHGNLLHQVTTLGVVVQPKPGDRVLTLLPTWHSFGRVGEYFLLAQGCTQIYTSIRHVKADFRKHKPQFMVGVPRLWESIYEGVQKQFREQPESRQKLVYTLLDFSRQYVEAKRVAQGRMLSAEQPGGVARAIASLKAAAFWPLHQLGERLVYRKVREATGGELTCVISGGGSLAMHLETFFEIVGVDVLVGYGLTETSPVLSARRSWHNLRGSSGRPIPGTALKIVDPETRQPLAFGDRGLVLAQGPQIMQGYFRNPTATAKAIDSEGWFDTGDLGWMTPNYDLVLTGRAKDTIVLTNGENIEPQPIEDACLRSAYIDQIMLVGQDQKSLGALIVPNLEALQQWAMGAGITSSPDVPPDLQHPKVQELIRQELNREVRDRPGYRPDDRIGPFRLMPEPFSVENGMMTQTLKIRRPVVMERYQGMIDEMFS